jgi:hypothetical protein
MDQDKRFSTIELENYLDTLNGKDQSLFDDGHFLLPEVRFSDLRKMSDANLEGRLAYYTRDYTFELNPHKRNEFYREMLRTKVEIAMRKRERVREAINAALPSHLPGDIEQVAA